MSNTDAAQVETSSSLSTTTRLTPNSQSVASMNTTLASISFQTSGTTYWSTSIGSSFTTAILGQNVGNDIVTFKQGLKVTYSAQPGGTYNVLLNGTIVDSLTTYQFTGTVIGVYTPSDL